MLSKYNVESSHYEKKQEVEKERPKSWLKTVCAFANGIGGEIIFGIKEDNTVLGIFDVKDDSEFISNTIELKIEPIPDFKLTIENIENKDIIFLKVKGGKNTPYVYKEGASLIPYIRVGNNTIPSKRLDLYNLSLKGQNKFYDETLSDVTINDATFKELSIEYKNRTHKAFNESDLLSFGLVNDNGTLTIAGTLFADNCFETPSRLFCTRWNGKTKNSSRIGALDDVEYEGNVLYLLNKGLDFVKKHTFKKMGERS